MYRMVDCGTWDDPWFAELQPAAKLLFLYLLTNRRSTPAGCFEITLRAICFETGLEAERVHALLPLFGDRVRWWPEQQVIWLKNFYRRQMGEKPNPKYREGARRALAEMPAVVRETVAKEYPDLRVAKDALSTSNQPDPMPHTSPIQGASTVVVVVPEVEPEPEEIEATPHSADAPLTRSEGDIYALVDAFAEGKGLKKTELTGALRQKTFRAMQSAPPWASPADVFACTKYLMSDPFWQMPGKLQGQQVIETLPDWRKEKPAIWQPANNGRASPSATGRNGAIDAMAKVRELERRAAS